MFIKDSFVPPGLPSALRIQTDPKRHRHPSPLRGDLHLHPARPAKSKTFPGPQWLSIAIPPSWKKLWRSSVSALLRCVSQTTELSKTFRSADSISSPSLMFVLFSEFQVPDFHRMGQVTSDGPPVNYHWVEWKTSGFIWGLPAFGGGCASLNWLWVSMKVSRNPLHSPSGPY